MLSTHGFAHLAILSWLEIISNKTNESDFTLPSDHQTSIFTRPGAKFTCPRQSDLFFIFLPCWFGRIIVNIAVCIASLQIINWWNSVEINIYHIWQMQRFYLCRKRTPGNTESGCVLTLAYPGIGTLVPCSNENHCVFDCIQGPCGPPSWLKSCIYD